MLYIVEKIFLQGVRFDIVYNDMSSETMNIFQKTFFFSQGLEKNIKVFKTETGVFETGVSHPTHIYL